MTVLTKLQGPTHIHPLQIDLGDGDVENEANVDVFKANNNSDKGKRPQQLQRSWEFTSRQCLSCQITDFEVFFSASSFYPGRHPDADTPIQYPNNDDLTDAHDGDTEVESEGDWLTDPEVLEPEPARRTSSKRMESTLVEVSTFYYYYY